jgi:GDP-4-dehydro-6-deoxy-D-mannose reductase
VRVLVTGSSGFVGHWMLRHLLERGDDILTFPDELDLRDRDRVTEAVSAAAPEGIVHLAAQASVGASWHEGLATWEINAVGAVNLLDAAAALVSPPRVLLISSAEVYGVLRDDELPVGEDHPFAPVSPYAASKAAAELAGLQAWLGQGLEVIRARPFNHTGPGQRPEFVVPGLARQVMEIVRYGGHELRTGNLAARRDLTDVRDVVEAYRRLLELGAPGAAYNVCRGTSVEMAEVCRRLMELAGVDVPSVVDPARIRPVDQPDLRGDPQRVARDTGWSPTISIDQTLTDVLAYWGEQLAVG